MTNSDECYRSRGNDKSDVKYQRPHRENQHLSVHLCRCRGRDPPEGSEDECPSSIPFLSRQIQSLKKKVRRFEDQFEHEMKYKVNTAGNRTPVHNLIQDPDHIKHLTEAVTTEC